MLFYIAENSNMSSETLTVGFLLYNTIAFGLQPFIGYYCDTKKSFPIAVYGCCLLIVGLVLISFTWVSIIICAFGNACFHIGGGIDSLVNADARMARSGIFVSSGALGVSIGTMAGKSNMVTLVTPIILLTLSCFLIICFANRGRTKYADIYFCNISASLSVTLVLALCLLSVFIRSFIGSVIPLAWKTTTFLILLPSFGAFIGKAAGGYLADLFGARIVSVATLLISLPFLCFGYVVPFYYSIGIILFNMTMPITLCAVSSKLPQNPGLAFGMTTLFLLAGNIPTFLFLLPDLLLAPILAVLIIISAICIYLSTTNKKGVTNHEKIYETA